MPCTCCMIYMLPFMQAAGAQKCSTCQLTYNEVFVAFRHCLADNSSSRQNIV